MQPNPTDYSDARFSEHALIEMAHRGISQADVRAVLRNPGRQEFVRASRVALTALENGPDGRQYVIRVFVDVDRQRPVVVTAYRSSKLGKYWSTP